MDEPEGSVDAETFRFSGLRLPLRVFGLSGQHERHECIHAATVQRVHRQRAYPDREDHSSADAEAPGPEERDVTGQEEPDDTAIAQQFRFHFLRPAAAESEFQLVGSLEQKSR